MGVTILEITAEQQMQLQYVGYIVILDTITAGLGLCRIFRLIARTVETEDSDSSP